MRTQRLRCLLVLACLVAIAVTALGARPGATRKPGAAWEYTVVDVQDLQIFPTITPQELGEMRRLGRTAAQSIEEEFDRLGAQGWELVSFSDRTAVFKRRAQ